MFYDTTPDFKQLTINALINNLSKSQLVVEEIDTKSFLVYMERLKETVEYCGITVSNDYGTVTDFYRQLVTDLRVAKINVFRLTFPDNQAFEIVMRFLEEVDKIQSYVHRV